MLVSSTVTTATVSVVTSASLIGLGSAASIFTLMSVLLLAAFLIGKEISVTASGGAIRSLARGLDVGAIPLLVGFVILMALRMFA